MFKKISFVLMLILTIALIFSCGNSKKYSSNQSWYNTAAKDGVLVTIYNIPITVEQLDSICFVDKLSTNLADWHSSLYIDYETKDTVYKYTYIKNNAGVQETYIISEFRDSLAIHKRIKK